MTGIYKITSPQGRIYIGQSKDCTKRFYFYKIASKYCYKQKRLYNSFLKYGVSNHIFEIIEECLFDELNTRERHWQEHYDVLNKNGLNCKYTNTDEKKTVMSEITKQKISEKNSGKKNGMYGKIGPNKGKTFSDDLRNKLSIAQKKLYENGYINPYSKKVLDSSTNTVYNSLSELCRKLDIKYDALKSKLNGRRKNNTNFIYLQ